MAYDPRARGPHPVGVHTTEVTKEDRSLPVELWYPASDRYAGADSDPGMRDAFAPYTGAATTWQAAVRDAAPRLGAFPLVVFSHELGGHRRQSTFLCTHLASHGYVVAAADHPGATTDEIAELARRVDRGEETDPYPRLSELSAARPAEIRTLVDALLEGTARAVTRSLQRDRVALIGHGIGGAGALAAASADLRGVVAVTMGPPGLDAPEMAPLAGALDEGFGRVVPVLVIAAERDAVTPVSGVRELVSQIRAPTRLAVLKNADHYHFCDQPERMHELFGEAPLPAVAGSTEGLSPIAELVPAERSYRVVRSICLAHLDAFVKARDGAKDALAEALAGRGASEANEAVDVELG